MKRSGSGLAILALLSAALLPKAASAATLVYSNDVMGEIEPCGCRNNPQGGMVRKAQLLKKLGDPEILQLDAGDLLFPDAALPESLKQQSELQAGFLLKAMDLSGHDAAVPGEKDFALGTATFEKLTSGSKIRFLAANLSRKNGKPLLPSHEIFTRRRKDGSQVRIAVLGLVGEGLSWPGDLVATSAVNAAKKLLPRLRKKADIVIALTHQGLEADKALAKNVSGIDVIVGAHTQSFLQTAESENGTLILQSSFRNQYVGVLPLDKPLSAERHQLVALDESYEPADSKADTQARLVAEFKSAVSELNTREEPVLTRLEADHKARYQTFARCAECHVKQFDFWRKTPHARALTPLLANDQIHNKECILCHSVGFGEKQGFSEVSSLGDWHDGDAQVKRWPAAELAQYLESVHKAKTLETPVRLTRSSQPLPLRDSLSRIDRAWAPVQCENCHSPGGDHPFSGTYSKSVEKTLCLKCHTAERAPGWYTSPGKPDWTKIEAKRKAIACPAGE